MLIEPGADPHGLHVGKLLRRRSERRLFEQPSGGQITPLFPGVPPPGVDCSITVAVADLVESARLVARTVTARALGMVAGAVYRPPALIVPAVALQATAKFVVPFTVAANCVVAESATFTVDGETVTLQAREEPS